MALVLHTRVGEEGRRYRVWTTEQDRYISPEMTEAEARDWYLQNRLINALHDYAREVDRGLASAKLCGEGWEEEQQVPFTAQEAEAMSEVHRRLIGADIEVDVKTIGKFKVVIATLAPYHQECS